MTINNMNLKALLLKGFFLLLFAEQPAYQVCRFSYARGMWMP